MEKLEYIPGDLVFHYIPKTTIKKYVKVYVCSTNNALSLEDMDGKLYDYIGVLYPIPLTPDILEKNGWEHKDDIYFKEFPHRKLVIMDENAYIINECCSMFLCPVKFVPQLQHLLFGLGLNHKMEV